MKRTIVIILSVLLVISLALFSAFALIKAKNDRLFAEELQRVQEAYPLYFELDTSEGLNILVYGDDKINFWSVRLVPGNKDSFSIMENARYCKAYAPISLEDAKIILAYYDLPDTEVILHPYDCWEISSYKLSHLMEDETYLSRMAEAFDNRYQMGEEFPVIYVPELDGTEPTE